MFQNLISGKMGISDLLPSKHMVDEGNCKDENARAARSQILKHVWYISKLAGQ